MAAIFRRVVTARVNVSRRVVSNFANRSNLTSPAFFSSGPPPGYSELPTMEDIPELMEMLRAEEESTRVVNDRKKEVEELIFPTKNGRCTVTPIEVTLKKLHTIAQQCHFTASIDS